MKQGAMFGLDARIALVIFGALSVISGAALYSAIGNAKATALLLEMQEIGKGWEQYYLDTSETLNSNAASGNDLYHKKTSQLVKDPNIAGWKGPYLNYSVDPVYTHLLTHPVYNHVFITINSNEQWGGMDNPSVSYCTAGKECSIWAHLAYVDDMSLIKKIDELVDGNDSPRSGDFRWTGYVDGGQNRVYLKIAPHKNPND